MPTSRSIVPWVLGLLILLGVDAAWAQDPIRLRVERSGARRVLVGIAPLETAGTAPELRAGAAALASRLARDLVYSGLIAVKQPMPDGVALPRRLPDSARVEGDTAPDYMIHLELAGDDASRLAWVGRLTLANAPQSLLAKRYTVDVVSISRPVHHLADAIVAQVTGEPGIAQTRIIFSRREGDANELYLLDYDGENLRRITRNGSLNLAPRWSPDGRRVCYTSYYEGKQRLLILDGSTGQSTNIAQFSGLNVGAAWSPDGRELAVTLSQDGNPEIYRIRPDGSVSQRLTFSPAIECSPYFGPNGRQIVYTSDRTGVPQIYVMDREGATRRRLTYEGRYNDSASWSPDGERIAYVSRREGRFTIYTIRPDGSDLVQVTFREDGNCEDPAWAPDSRHLVMSSDRSGQRKLWIHDVETGVARPLTTGDGEDSSPHWSAPPREDPAPAGSDR